MKSVPCGGSEVNLKIGRNEPCPCGSGKKYKRCCLAKDEQARAQATVAEAQRRLKELTSASSGDEQEPVSAADASPLFRPHTEAAPEPRDPKIDALNARWEAFETKDYEGQVALYLQTLNEPVLMDDDMASDMLSSLWSAAAEHGEMQRFCEWVDALRQRL